ncbi:MAG: NADH-quinone oxidoreductase subunit A [Chloroflexota bacterium]
MPADYLPLLFLILVAALFAVVAIGLPSLLGPRKPNPAKMTTYECGKLPFGEARRSFPIHYYMVAMLFLVFDIEVIFLYPWAVLYRSFDPMWFGLIEMAVFVAFLLVGYIYCWRKGALEWD